MGEKAGKGQYAARVILKVFVRAKKLCGKLLRRPLVLLQLFVNLFNAVFKTKMSI